MLPCGCRLSVPVALVLQAAAIGVVCMQATTMQRCLHVHIYTVHTQFCHRTAAGHARRVQRVDLLHTMEHLCMTAHKHNTRHPHTEKFETCGSTDSSSNLGSCGAVLSLQEARQQARLYHSMLYVPVSMQAALVQKGTWKTIEVARRKLSGTVTRWEALTVLVVAFRPSVPACILPARKAMLMWRGEEEDDPRMRDPHKAAW